VAIIVLEFAYKKWQEVGQTPSRPPHADLIMQLNVSTTTLKIKLHNVAEIQIVMSNMYK
jgi:hypothetical protein